ncbi:MAG: hypothetical protein JNL77_03095 [Nitrosomonas sp.]|nr:hypothetical protein [Nitrosomonas sp.]
MSYTEKQFLEELSALQAELRRDIEAHAIGLDPSKKAIAERRRRVLKDGDFKFFAYTYFPHHIRGEPSLFQKAFCERFPKLMGIKQGIKEWFEAPRGEAKSSLLTKIGPVYISIRELLQRAEIRSQVGWDGETPPSLNYGVLLGAETSLPTKLLEVIKTELTVNAALELDFPEVFGRGPMWKVGEIVTRTGVKIEPFGGEQAIRGTFHGSSRPSWLFGDDLITDAEAKSVTEREKRWDWLEKAIDYLGSPDGTVKFLAVGTDLGKGTPINQAKNTIGNVVHAFKAIERFPDRMDLWEQCEELMRNEDARVAEEYTKRGEVCPDDALPSKQFYDRNKVEMDKGAITSWPSVRSLYWLMRQRAKNRRAFDTEMQGVSRSAEDKVFSAWQFWVQRLPHWIIFGGCDPSMGKGETSDPSAIVIGGYDRNAKKLHVVEAAIKRRVPSKLEYDLVEAQREFKCIAWGFENNGAFEHSRQTFIKAGMDKGIPLPLIGITATVAPEVRIDSLEPHICDAFEPRILFHARLIQLLDELENWPEKQPHHHYDGLTALHILWMVATTRSGSIEYTSAKKSNDDSEGFEGQGAW